MPIRQKTIEYNFDSVVTPVPNMTGNTSSVLMVHIPETGSRNFRSAWLKTYMRDTNAATTSRGSLQQARTKLRFNNVETSDHFVNYHTAFIDTGEQQIISFIDDFTDEFNSFFTASAVSMSATLWYSASLSSPEFTNITRKLYITYDFDDTNANRRIKTVKIPMEYYTSSMPVSPMPIPYTGGPAQIPALNTFCPESNKTFRDIWIEFSGMERDTTTGANDTFLSMSLDNGPMSTVGVFEQANISNIPVRIAYDISTMDTSTTHSLRMQRNGDCNFVHCSPILHATYEYDHNSSTRILNSIQESFVFPGFTAFGNTNDLFAYTIPVVIPEENPTLRQSGLLYYLVSTTAGATQIINIGSGSARTGGLSVAPGTWWGQGNLMMRIDTSSIYHPQTSSLLSPLVRGTNNIRSSWRVTSNPQRTAPPLVALYLNYESDKHTNGSEVHNKTIRRLQISGSTWGTVGYVVARNTTISNNIPEADYFVNYYGYQYTSQRVSTSNRIMYNPVEPSASFDDFYNTLYDGNYCESYLEDGIPLNTGASELSIVNGPIPDQTRVFRRYPNQATSSTVNPMEGSLNFQITRSFICNTDSVRHAFSDVITYHSITFPVTGTLSGYTGDGSGITVVLHDAATGKALKSTTTTTGGAYTMSWYDPTQQLYVESIQDSTHTGRSANGSFV